jgi:hypothetical protein
LTSPLWTSGDVPDQLLSAASRLHGSSWDEQLAGACALAKLADQWYSEGANAHAQHCIDVLCAYLRVRRYVPRPGSDQAESAVRDQITLLLMDFLRSGLGGARGGILLNLAAVRLQGHHVFDGVSFGPGLRLILDRAHVGEGSSLSFDNCRFQGCIVRLLGVSLEKHAVLSLVRSTVDAGAWLLASTADVHPSARVDVQGITARANQGARAYLMTGNQSAQLSSVAGTH